MKALVKKGRGQVSLEQVPEPIPGINDIKVKVLRAGICGTDIHILKDEYPYNPPVIMGHEYVGVVVEVGQGVTSFVTGDYVVSLTAVKTCGHCTFCKQGLLMLCEERESIGSGRDGVFAEYVVIPEHIAYKITIEKESELLSYAICEPLSCVTRCVIERAAIKPGHLVLVSGPGSIGLIALQLAKIQGAYVILSGIEKDRDRLQIGLNLGADQVVSSSKDLQSAVAKISDYGCDVALECSGASSSADACIEMLKKQGQYVQLGLFGKKIPFDMDLCLRKEITLSNGFASEPSSWDIALGLLEQKKVDLLPLVSHQFDLINWEKAFDTVLSGNCLKVLLKP